MRTGRDNKMYYLSEISNLGDNEDKDPFNVVNDLVGIPNHWDFNSKMHRIS
jgi:hypothetical protein